MDKTIKKIKLSDGSVYDIEALHFVAGDLNTPAQWKAYIDRIAELGFEIVVLTTLPKEDATSYETYHNNIVLITDNTSVTGSSVEYVIVRSGTSESYTYKWEKIGTTTVDLSNYVTLNTEQKITGAKAFTGQVGNKQSESGVYLGLDTNTANANIAITSANTAAYIDMGKPNHDYDFRLIKWDSNNGNTAQMCYNTEDGGASANITIPRASGTLALTSDIPSRVSTSASSYSHIDYISAENANSTYQVAFTNNEQSYGICWSKFANISTTSSSPSECTYNGFFYANSFTNSLSGADANPFIQYHGDNGDFRILTTAYSDQWLQQIATDFRTPYIYTRRRENGSWSNWVRLLDTTGGTLYKTTSSQNDPVLYVLQDGAIGLGQGYTAVANFTAYSESPYGLQIQISPAGDTTLQSRRIGNDTEKFPLQLNPEGGPVYANGALVATHNDLNYKTVGALPDYTVTISHQSVGNPHIIKFVSVNYSSVATCFKMGAMTCHDNGLSYKHLTDILISVTTAGEVYCDIFKFAQQSVGSVDGVARCTGDVFYVNNTSTKVVDFYILCGQWSSSQFTPITGIGSTSIAGVTQYSGSEIGYSDGTKVWANGCGRLMNGYEMSYSNGVLDITSHN